MQMTWFTMLTGEKRTWSSYFLPVELEILMTACADKEHTHESNPLAAAKERKLAWQKTVDQGNEWV